MPSSPAGLPHSLRDIPPVPEPVLTEGAAWSALPPPMWGLSGDLTWHQFCHGGESSVFTAFMRPERNDGFRREPAVSEKGEDVPRQYAVQWGGR